jgi:hypothetical protein
VGLDLNKTTGELNTILHQENALSPESALRRGSMTPSGRSADMQSMPSLLVAKTFHSQGGNRMRSSTRLFLPALAFILLRARSPLPKTKAGL